MNFKGIIYACDDDELKVILDAILLRNKRLLSEFIQEHPELIEAPVEAPEEPEIPELTEDEKKDLGEIIHGVIKSQSTSKAGTALEDVIKDVMSLDYERDHILEAIDVLLDQGIIYEPDVGLLNYVDY